MPRASDLALDHAGESPEARPVPYLCGSGPMSTDRVIAPLQCVPLFASLTLAQITEIARLAERLRFHAGDVITRAGAPGDGAFLIVSGVAGRVEHVGGPPSGQVEMGSLIGEMAMLVEHDYGSTIVARDRVLCLKITRANLHAQMLEDPSLAAQLERQIAERLKRTAEMLREIDASLAAFSPDGEPRVRAVAPGARF
jgi:CRP/FNR family transcriptional regulator, cyclic AMP receptor protein